MSHPIPTKTISDILFNKLSRRGFPPGHLVIYVFIKYIPTCVFSINSKKILNIITVKKENDKKYDIIPTAK